MIGLLIIWMMPLMMSLPSSALMLIPSETISTAASGPRIPSSSSITLTSISSLTSTSVLLFALPQLSRFPRTEATSTSMLDKSPHLLTFMLPQFARITPEHSSSHPLPHMQAGVHLRLMNSKTSSMLARKKSPQHSTSTRQFKNLFK